MEDAAAAARRFVELGDTTSATLLHQHMRCNMNGAQVDLMDSFAPSLLRWLLQPTPASAPITSITAFVAVMNQVWAVRLVPPTMAQPIEQRPVRMDELLADYISMLSILVMRVEEGGAVQVMVQQLTKCVASLMILCYDNIADGINVVRSSISASLPHVLCCHLIIHLVEVLSDRKIAFGPIRRAHTKKQLQQNMKMMLDETTALLSLEQQHSSSSSSWMLAVETLERGAHFLSAAGLDEAQCVAPLFWEELPQSLVWQRCITALTRFITSSSSSSSSDSCPSIVVEAICSVFRCITFVDECVEALITPVLMALIHRNNNNLDASSAEDVCVVEAKIIATALEVAAESVVMDCSTESSIFVCMASAAARLVDHLRNPSTTSEAVLYVCEGVAALTQVLQPAPLPTMEPSDDAEDFAEMMNELVASNQHKMLALERLREYLQQCAIAMATRLLHVAHMDAMDCQHVHHRLSPASTYALERAELSEEDFGITYDDEVLALFATYERILQILGGVPEDVVRLATSGDGVLMLLATSPAYALQAMMQMSLMPLCRQSMWLPVVVRRFTHHESGWGAEERQHVMMMLWGRLMEMLPHMHVEAAARIAAPHLLDAITMMDLPQQQQSSSSVGDGVCGASVAAVGVELVMRQLPPSPLEPRWRCTSALCRLADQSEACLISPSMLGGDVHRLDARTRMELASCLSVQHLHAFLELSKAEDVCCVAECFIKVAAHRMMLKVRAHISSVMMMGAAHQAYMDELRGVLHQCTSTQPPLPHIMLMCLINVVDDVVQRGELLLQHWRLSWANTSLAEIATSELHVVMHEEACTWAAVYVVCAPSRHTHTTALELVEMLRGLLQPCGSYSMGGDGLRRLAIVVCCARVLYETCAKASVAMLDVWPKMLVLALDRWMEMRSSPEVWSSATSRADDDDDDDMADVQQQLRDDLGVLGECVLLAENMAEMRHGHLLAQLRGAIDCHERSSIIMKYAGI